MTDARSNCADSATILVCGDTARIPRAATPPPPAGMRTSSSATSGRAVAAASTAATASFAVATTTIDRSPPSSSVRASTTSGRSSAINTLIRVTVSRHLGGPHRTGSSPDGFRTDPTLGLGPVPLFLLRQIQPADPPAGIARRVVQQLRGDDPRDLELQAVGIGSVQALRGPVIARAGERAGISEHPGQAFELRDRVHLPREVIQPNRRTTG